MRSETAFKKELEGGGCISGEVGGTSCFMRNIVQREMPYKNVTVDSGICFKSTPFVSPSHLYWVHPRQVLCEDNKDITVLHDLIQTSFFKKILKRKKNRVNFSLIYFIEIKICNYYDALTRHLHAFFPSIDLHTRDYENYKKKHFCLEKFSRVPLFWRGSRMFDTSACVCEVIQELKLKADIQ